MLKIKDLIVSYDNSNIKNAVDGISFNLSHGENVALIGANGAGKTTLLHSIVGVIDYLSGEISVDDLILNKKSLKQIRAKIGLVFQNPDDQLFMPNIFEDMAFGLRAYGFNEQKVEENVNKILEELKILHLKNNSPLKLSGGEKRLCAIAAVLAIQPEYLLFDEPTAFLDPRARRNLEFTLRNLTQGKLIATHDLNFARNICNRVLIVKDGKIIKEGNIDLLEDDGRLEEWGL